MVSMVNIGLSKYKRRKVSAVRNFPPGCGPNAPRSDLNGNETVCCSENDKNTNRPSLIYCSDTRTKKKNHECPADDSSNEDNVLKCLHTEHVNKESLYEETEEHENHYPIPSNTVWKEKNYPPRRRVSAVRTYPAGLVLNHSKFVDSLFLAR